MSDLLTTKELQTLLGIDRKTVYRMLKDDQLPAVRVGGQWRFPRQAIQHWLHQSDNAAEPMPRLVADDNNDILPTDCFSSIQDVFAEAVGVGAITTDLEGNPLTEMSNSAKYCQLLLASPEGRKRCQASWRRLSAGAAPPKLETCHAGLAYARGKIQVQDEFVAMVFAGQVVTSAGARKRVQSNTRALAQACGIPETKLRAAAAEIQLVEAAHADKMLRMLAKVADTFSQIGRRRLDLLLRLRRVAQIARI